LLQEDMVEANLYRPVRRYCQEVGMTVDDLISPNMFTVLLKTVIEEVDVNTRLEDLLRILLQNSSFAAIFNYTTGAIPDVLVELKKRYVAPSSTQDVHYSLDPRYSPLSLTAPVVSACSLCGESFVTVNELRSNFLSCETILERRTQHFEKHFGGLLPSDTTVHYNIHRTVRLIAENHDCTEITRGMVLEVLRYLRVRCVGGIYIPHLLRSIVVTLWDYIQKKRQTPALSDELGREERLLAEFIYMQETGTMFGQDLATLDGLTDEQQKELLAPLTETEEMDMILNCDVPALVGFSKSLKIQNPNIKMFTLV